MLYIIHIRTGDGDFRARSMTNYIHNLNARTRSRKEYNFHYAPAETTDATRRNVAGRQVCVSVKHLCVLVA